MKKLAGVLAGLLFIVAAETVYSNGVGIKRWKSVELQEGDNLRIGAYGEMNGNKRMYYEWASHEDHMSIDAFEMEGSTREHYLIEGESIRIRLRNEEGRTLEFEAEASGGSVIISESREDRSVYDRIEKFLMRSGVVNVRVLSDRMELYEFGVPTSGYRRVRDQFKGI